MKQVHVAKHAPEAHIVKGWLESNGIAAIIRGEFLTSGWGELPVDVCSVWIADDSDYERARSAIAEFLSGSGAHASQPWRCCCGEQLEGQFTKCWKCGTSRA